MLQATVLVMGVFSSLLIGWFVFTRDPKKHLNQLYGLLTLAFVSLTVFNHLTLTVSPNLLLYMRLVIVSTTIAAAILFFLVMEIRAAARGRRLPRYATYGLVALTGLVVVLELSPAVFMGLSDSSSPTPVPGWGVSLFVMHFIFFIGACVAVLFRGARHAPAKERKQFQAMRIGMVPILVLAPITSVLLPIFFQMTAFIIFSPLYLVFFLATVGYAIVKHGLFDVRLAAVRTLAYALSLVTLAGLYAAIAFSISQIVFEYQASLQQNAVNIVLALVLAFIFQPVKQFFDVLTDKVFYRNEYVTQNVLDRLGDVVAHNVLLRPLMSQTLDVIDDSLRPSALHFALVDDNRLVKHVKRGSDEYELDQSTVAVLRSLKEPVTIVELLLDDSDIKKKLTGARVAVAASFKTKQNLYGYIMLDDRASGAKYMQRDIDLLAVIADELTVAIENSMRYEEIKAFNVTLQEKVEEATRELKITNKKLQELDKSKDEFISMASHQLRTPLTAVKGYISMVLEGDIGKITPTQREVLEQAYDSSQRMVFLIGDFLNVSRLQTGKFVLEPSVVNFTELVAEEIDQLKDTARARKISFSYQKPAVVYKSVADENKLRQVMMNFMDNAIYYSPSGSSVDVLLYKDADGIVFKVSDHGIGVPKAEQAKLFTKFFRAGNARQQRPDGTGIGIYMAKKVILAHEGTIIFESKEGQGSTFGFKLPLKDDLKQLDKQPDTAAKQTDHDRAHAK